MHLDKLKIKGIVTLKHYSANGVILNEIVNRNLIVDSGLSFFIDKLLNLTEETIDYIGIGNGFAVASSEQTGLLADASDPSFLHKTAYKQIRYKRNLDGKNLLVEALFVDNEYLAEVAEVGLFTNVVDNDNIPSHMIARTVIEGNNRFTKAPADYLSISWNIQFGD